MLGGSAPEVVTAPSAASAASSDPAASEAAAKERVKLDQDKPATNIQVITFYATLLSALFDFPPFYLFVNGYSLLRTWFCQWWSKAFSYESFCILLFLFSFPLPPDFRVASTFLCKSTQKFAKTLVLGVAFILPRNYRLIFVCCFPFFQRQSFLSSFISQLQMT